MAELGLVLLALFLIEGLRWIPRRSVAFGALPWGGFAVRRPRTLRDGARRGWLLPAPWLPAMEQFVAHRWPFVLSPEGVVFREARPNEAPLGWDRVGAVRVKGPCLTYEGRTLADVGSPRASRRLRDVLHRIASASSAEREAVIRAAIAENFDDRHAEERRNAVRAAVTGWKWLAWILTANLFVTGPLLGDTIGRAHVWPVWAAIHVGLTVLVVTAFFKGTRVLGDSGPDSGLTTLVTLMLYPPATARFLEALTSDALSDLDPLACGAVVLDSASFEQMARDRLGRLELLASTDRIAAWFCGVVRNEILALTERVGLQAETILAAPPPDPDAEAYCPSCRTQYRSGVDCCVDCPRVVLVRFFRGSVVAAGAAGQAALRR